MKGSIGRRLTVSASAMLVAALAAGCSHHAPPQVAAAPAPAPKHTTAWEDSVVLARMAADKSAADAKKAALAKAEADEKARLASMTYFNFDKSLLSDADKAILDAKIPILQESPTLKIQVVGNCDDRGSDEYNLALGQARAAAAKRYLVDHGIADDRIEVMSYGKERPVAPGDDEGSRALNRNDQFVVIAGTTEVSTGPN